GSWRELNWDLAAWFAYW
nr:immunoglobulin heavy chain junction region [Mus musculus]